MNLTDIIGTYIIINIIILSITLPKLYFDDSKFSTFKTISIFQWTLYEDIKDKLNIFGIIILEIIITMLTLGTSLTLLIGIIVIKMLSLFWKIFCFVFKKKKGES